MERIVDAKSDGCEVDDEYRASYRVDGRLLSLKEPEKWFKRDRKNIFSMAALVDWTVTYTGDRRFTTLVDGKEVEVEIFEPLGEYGQWVFSVLDDDEWGCTYYRNEAGQLCTWSRDAGGFVPVPWPKPPVEAAAHG